MQEKIEKIDSLTDVRNPKRKNGRLQYYPGFILDSKNKHPYFMIGFYFSCVTISITTQSWRKWLGSVDIKSFGIGLLSLAGFEALSHPNFSSFHRPCNLYSN